MNLSQAVFNSSLCTLHSSLPRHLRALLRLRAGVAFERARGRELAQLVADHVLGHIDRDMPLAVVHGEGQADKVRRDHRAPRPSLDRGRTRPTRADALYCLGEGFVNESPLLN